MEKIELLFSEFLNKNSGNKYLKNRSEIKQLVDKVFSMSDIKTNYNDWSKFISIDSILLGIDGFGGCFIFSSEKFVYISTGFNKKPYIDSLDNFIFIGGNPKSDFPPVWGKITFQNITLGNISTTKKDLFTLIDNFKNEVIQPLIEYSNEEKERLKRIELEKERVLENLRLNKLNNHKNSVILELDKNKDGEVDLIDNDSFNKLLNKNQRVIIETDKTYIQKFVKINLYLKTKKSNTQIIFESLKNSKNQNELDELVNLLKNQIHTYELLVFHSISMITSFVENDLITFYEIYECFDQLGVFNSNWENEVSNKLSDIGDGIKDLMYSIYEMENKIVGSIEHLTYVTQDSFNDLQMSISRELQDIDSSIQVNNLLTGIQTYQMYKINQNTKRIG